MSPKNSPEKRFLSAFTAFLMLVLQVMPANALRVQAAAQGSTLNDLRNSLSNWTSPVAAGREESVAAISGLEESPLDLELPDRWPVYEDVLARINGALAESQVLATVEDKLQEKDYSSDAAYVSLSAGSGIGQQIREELTKNGVTADNWGNVYIPADFTLTEAARIRNVSLSGTVVFGRLLGTVEVPPLVEGGKPRALPTGVQNTALDNVILGDNVLVQNNTLVSDYVIGDGAVVTANNMVVKDPETAFGMDVDIVVGPETGGKEFKAYPEMLFGDAVRLVRSIGKSDGTEAEQADATARAQYLQAHQQYVDRVKTARYGYIGNGAYVSGAVGEARNLFVADHNRVVATPIVANVLITFNETGKRSEIVGANRVQNGIMQPKTEILSGAVVMGEAESDMDSGFTLFEHSEASQMARVKNSAVGPNSGVSAGELTSTLQGASIGMHHESLVIATDWADGLGNVGAGVMAGSNHTGRKPDQMTQWGEGVFIGLAAQVKFPTNTSAAPYTVFASGVLTLPQRLEMPFSLVTKTLVGIPELSAEFNQIKPNWVWDNSAYAIMRNEGKYQGRDKAPDHNIGTSDLQRFPYEVLRPSIVNQMIRAREALMGADPSEAIETTVVDGRGERLVRYYTERQIPGLGKNFILEEDRQAAIDSYTRIIQLYALRGLKAQAEATTTKTADELGKILSDANQAPTPLNPADYADDGDNGRRYRSELAQYRAQHAEYLRAEHERRVLNQEFRDLTVSDGLVKLVQMEKKLAEDVAKSKGKDDIRGQKIIDDYEQWATLAGADSFVTDTAQAAETLANTVAQDLLPDYFQSIPQENRVLAVELGGNYIRVAIVDRTTGQVLVSIPDLKIDWPNADEKFQTDNAASVLEQVNTHVGNLLNSVGLTITDVDHLAIDAPGEIDVDGFITLQFNLPFQGQNMLNAIADTIGFTGSNRFLLNDMYPAVVSEMTEHAGGAPVVVYNTVSSGHGGGVIVVSDSRFLNLEPGQIPLDPEGGSYVDGVERIRGGESPIVEHFDSGDHLARRAQYVVRGLDPEHVRDPRLAGDSLAVQTARDARDLLLRAGLNPLDRSLFGAVTGSTDPLAAIDGKVIGEAARSGQNVLAATLLTQSARAVAHAIVVQAERIVDNDTLPTPERLPVVLGGGVIAGNNDYYMDQVRDQVASALERAKAAAASPLYESSIAIDVIESTQGSSTRAYAGLGAVAHQKAELPDDNNWGQIGSLESDAFQMYSSTSLALFARYAYTYARQQIMQHRQLGQQLRQDKTSFKFAVATSDRGDLEAMIGAQKKAIKLAGQSLGVEIEFVDVNTADTGMADGVNVTLDEAVDGGLVLIGTGASALESVTFRFIGPTEGAVTNIAAEGFLGATETASIQTNVETFTTLATNDRRLKTAFINAVDSVGLEEEFEATATVDVDAAVVGTVTSTPVGTVLPATASIAAGATDIAATTTLTASTTVSDFDRAQSIFVDDAYTGTRLEIPASGLLIDGYSLPGGGVTPDALIDAGLVEPGATRLLMPSAVMNGSQHVYIQAGLLDTSVVDTLRAQGVAVTEFLLSDIPEPDTTASNIFIAAVPHDSANEVRMASYGPLVNLFGSSPELRPTSVSGLATLIQAAQQHDGALRVNAIFTDDVSGIIAIDLYA